MNYKNLFILALSIPTLSILPVFGQGQPPAAVPTRRPASLPVAEQPQTLPAPSGIAVAPSQEGELQSFAFEGAPLEVVMEEYARWTDKIYLKTDAVKANITLKADKLTTEESIKVVEAILAMNNIALVPMGDRYVKVVQATAADLTGQGIILDKNPASEIGDGNGFITKIIQLQNVEIPEVQAAVQHVMHAYGKILGLQRSNSLMITDTESNIKRAIEIIEFIDQATAGIDSRIYQIEHAEAQEIASKLKEIIDAAKGEDPTPASNPYARAGVIRAGTRANTRATTPAAPTKASIGQTEGGATTIIHGEVKVLADERTNLIIIFSQEENFAFFDKIIKVLDIEVEPATTFEVIGLEYADAVDLSGTLNDLIGAATGSRSSSSSTSRNSSTSRTTGTSRNNTSSRTTGSSSSRVTPNAAPGTASIENLNRLSEDTKILADERSNSILLMGSKGDIAAIKEVIKHLDIMLEQVVIEAAIFEVGLSDGLQHGMSWLYKSQDGLKAGAWDGEGLSTNSINNVAAGALTYYQNITGINTELAINLAAQDNDARLVSTPVIMTTDNTEATLSVGEQRPVVTSTSSYANSSGTQSSTYEYKDIGIQLTVTPRINPQRMVVMELAQKADQLGGNVTIDGNDVPIILNREFEASVAVPDGGTVVLGGLVQNEWQDNVTKIPILGDIPFIGRYLFSSVTTSEVQRELMVLMTPYVVTNGEEAVDQTEELYKSTSIRQADWGMDNWSESKLREIPDPVEEGEEGEEGEETAENKKTSSTSSSKYRQPMNEPAATSSSSQTEQEDLMQLLEEMNSQPAG